MTVMKTHCREQPSRRDNGAPAKHTPKSHPGPPGYVDTNPVHMLLLHSNWLRNWNILGGKKKSEAAVKSPFLGLSLKPHVESVVVLSRRRTEKTGEDNEARLCVAVICTT